MKQKRRERIRQISGDYRQIIAGKCTPMTTAEGLALAIEALDIAATGNVYALAAMDREKCRVAMEVLGGMEEAQ